MAGPDILKYFGQSAFYVLLFSVTKTEYDENKARSIHI